MTLFEPELFVDSRCTLGEGPLWHPGRRELFWFDIAAGMLWRANPSGDILAKVPFGEPVSAAAIVDDKTLLVASASAIFDFDIETGRFSRRLPLEADNPVTRSNDGRVDAQGGWWLSTMGRALEPGAASVYHYAGGALIPIRTGLTIPNAICFSPDGRFAYMADTPTRRIDRVSLDRETGLPAGEWAPFIDLAGQPGFPDGAVVDAEGFLWNAEYGGGRVVRYDPSGRLDHVVALPCPNITCPAFGGDDLRTLYVTTASDGMTTDERARQPHGGSVFRIDIDVPGQAERPILL